MCSSDLASTTSTPGSRSRGGLPPCDPFTAPEPCPDPKDTGSPIIIDILHKGFHLTSAEDGVMFDIAGDGKPIKMGWTAAGSQNAFLALPQGALITTGKELFGNFTPQPLSSHPNGFLALAEYDKMVKGGNGDGIIDAKDAIYSSLRLWIDENHDGMAQPNEIHTLPEMGVFSISLRYVLSAKTDRFGNAFRFRGRINVTDQQEDESIGADFLLLGPLWNSLFIRWAIPQYIISSMWTPAHCHPSSNEPYDRVCPRYRYTERWACTHPMEYSYGLGRVKSEEWPLCRAHLSCEAVRQAHSFFA